MNNFTITFNCNVCGLPTSNTLVLSTKYWDEKTGLNRITGKHWSEDYSDVRHESCELEHGSFKEMVNEYLEKVSSDPFEAELFVKVTRKKADFDTELAKKVDKLKEKNDIINT